MEYFNITYNCCCYCSLFGLIIMIILVSFLFSLFIFLCFVISFCNKSHKRTHIPICMHVCCDIDEKSCDACASLDEFIVIRFVFFRSLLLMFIIANGKTSPSYNSNNNIYTYSTCVSCTNIISCGHIWNICQCYWTWQLLLFSLSFYYLYFVCYLRRYFFWWKEGEELLLQKRILKLQPNEQCLCGWFNLSNNANAEPKPYILVEASIRLQFWDIWTKMANKLTYRYKHHNITK